MTLVLGLIGFGLLAAMAYMLYLAVIIGGAILLTGLVLIVGIYVGLVDSVGPEATWSIIFVIGVGLTLFLLHANAEKERIETARLAEEEKQRAIAIEAERQRRIALDAADKAATEAALAKAWHDRSLDDWKRVWFD